MAGLPAVNGTRCRASRLRHHTNRDLIIGKDGKIDMTTCGQIYKQVIEAVTGMDEEKMSPFAAGFMAGQCEKVYLGACKAAMFRPSRERLDEITVALKPVVDIYGLTSMTVDTSKGTEIWVSAILTQLQIAHMNLYEENSPMWHRIRGVLCGIPPHKVDEKFHERAGWGTTV